MTTKPERTPKGQFFSWAAAMEHNTTTGHDEFRRDADGDDVWWCVQCFPVSEVDRLRKRIRVLEEALRGIASCAWDCAAPGTSCKDRARAALATHTEEGRFTFPDGDYVETKKEE